MLDNRGRISSFYLKYLIYFALGWYNDNSDISNFATSLPRTIITRPSAAYAIPDEVIIINVFFVFIYLYFKDDNNRNDLERIGKSFRELSQSMCTDGTELFGDLPSPRLNARYT